jgi:hypothetical protein
MFHHLNVEISDKNINYQKALEIGKEDREILKGLAARVAEIASKPEQEAKKKLWERHNALEPTRPVIFADPENGWNEIITDEQIKCKNEIARFWEARLRKEIFWGESMGCDKVIETVFNIPHVYTESDWGMSIKRIGSEEATYRLDGGSYKMEAPLKDYQDLDKLCFPKIEVELDLTEKVLEIAKEIMGEFLKVQIKTAWWWSVGLTDDVDKLRGMEKMLYDFYEYPDELHRLMGILRDGTLAKLDFLEEQGLLSLNNDGPFVGSGGYGWTKELPQADFNGKVRPIDMWGMSESQITIGISPDMFEEFIFQYQLPIIERFGLNCYGCCEPLDKRWQVVQKIPRLKRVSVSAWANVQDMADKLQDKYIYSVKPNPADLALLQIDEEKIRKDIRELLQITRNCRVEVCMKDNHTLGKNPENIIRWCRIVKEEAEALD